MDLDRLIRSTLGRLRRVELGEGGEHPYLITGFAAAMVIRGRGAIDHRPRELCLHRHVRELELDRLMLRQRHPESLALFRVCK